MLDFKFVRMQKIRDNRMVHIKRLMSLRKIEQMNFDERLKAIAERLPQNCDSSDIKRLFDHYAISMAIKHA